MSKKEDILNRIIDIVIDCCDMRDNQGNRVVTHEKVLGRCKEENVVMTRCIIVFEIVRAGGYRLQRKELR